MPQHYTIGVLALQGGFSKHIEMLRQLGIKAKEIRRPEELATCDALIIPGGESTVISRQMRFIELEEALHSFAKNKPVFGTCAGCILMSKEIVGGDVKPFGLIDIAVERNAFGRQAESFQTNIEITLSPDNPQLVSAIFIRAPRIRRCSHDVKVLSQYEGEPVLVQQGIHLAATFHPELTSNTAIHRYFLTLL